jgi:hypothetical protein
MPEFRDPRYRVGFWIAAAVLLPVVVVVCF